MSSRLSWFAIYRQACLAICGVIVLVIAASTPGASNPRSNVLPQVLAEKLGVGLHFDHAA
jgi:hypothetical protein